MKFYTPSEIVEIGWSNLVPGGQGLFAKQDIGVNSNIGLIRIETNKQIYRVDFGGYGNHSETPNAQTITTETIANPQDDIEYIKSKTMLKAIKNIARGEEITWKYTLPAYDSAPWKKTLGQ